MAIRKPRPGLKKVAVVAGAAVIGGALTAGYARKIVMNPKNPETRALVQRTVAEANAGSKDAQARLRIWKRSASEVGGILGGAAGASLGFGLTRKRSQRRRESKK